MLFVGNQYAGPKTRWQNQLEMCSKNGLLLLLDLLFTTRDIAAGGTDHQRLLEDALWAKECGHMADSNQRIQHMIDDPDTEYESYERRRRSAKAAANRRKKKARMAAKEAH